MRLEPVSPWIDGTKLPMVFDISMGVRRDDETLWHEVNQALYQHKAEIAAILDDYGVPGIGLGSAAE